MNNEQMNPLNYYIKKRGTHNVDQTRHNYQTESGTFDIIVTVEEWTLNNEWALRTVNCNAYGDRRDYHHSQRYYANVPFLSRPIRLVEDGEWTTIEEPTRTDHIQNTVRALRAMIHGAEPDDPETEFAVREVLEEQSDDDDTEWWLVA